MTQHTVKQAAEPMAPETKPPGDAMAMCPMAKMCAGITQKRPSIESIQACLAANELTK